MAWRPPSNLISHTFRLIPRMFVCCFVLLEPNFQTFSPIFHLPPAPSPQVINRAICGEPWKARRRGAALNLENWGGLLMSPCALVWSRHASGVTDRKSRRNSKRCQQSGRGNPCHTTQKRPDRFYFCQKPLFPEEMPS